MNDMNDRATLIYKTTELIDGNPVENITKQEVFCEINTLSHKEQTRISSLGFQSLIKCLINAVHDNKNLVEVTNNDITYTIKSKDRFKNGDLVSLLLETRPNDAS